MKISIIGAAGYVGSNVALILALQGLANEIVLIDPPKPNVVTQLAMDVGTAAAEEEVNVRAGEISDMKGSHIIIASAGAPQGFISSRMEMLPKNMPIIREVAENIKTYAPSAIVITATNPVDPLNYLMYRQTGFDRSKIIGYSSNDTLRFRQIITQTFGLEFTDVEGFIIGEHGETQVPFFSTILVKGNSIHIDNNAKQKIRTQIGDVLHRFEELKTGRTAGITSAIGIRDIVKAIINNTHQIIPSSAVLDGEYGQHNISMGVPLVLGAGGIIEIKELTPASDEMPYLEKTVEFLELATKQVDAYLGSPLAQ
jgi:malate/lactate dehydrogenase